MCDCCFGEQLDNKKPFRPLYIFKHMLKNNFILFIRECRITTGQKSFCGRIHGTCICLKYSSNPYNVVLSVICEGCNFTLMRKTLA